MSESEIIEIINSNKVHIRVGYILEYPKGCFEKIVKIYFNNGLHETNILYDSEVIFSKYDLEKRGDKIIGKDIQNIHKINE